MIAKCITDFTPTEKHPFGEKHSGESLTVGCFYVIYAVGSLYGVPTYFITIDEYNWFPRYISAYCFDPPIGTFPPGMVVDYWSSHAREKFMVCQTEFQTNIYFMDQLTDGDVEARKQWIAFKSRSEDHALEEIMKMENPEEIVSRLKIQPERFQLWPMV